MKVLVLGGSGYVGARLVSLLRESGWARVTSACWRAQPGAPGVLRLDPQDGPTLARALEGMDAVVHCIAGEPGRLASGARILAAAALQAGCPRIVHLGSMAVYGAQEGWLREPSALRPASANGLAQQQAEQHIAAFAGGERSAVLLRPGCVWGGNHPAWVARVAGWLRAGRLGDLGVQGDGWSNLVHLDDVCLAIIRALQLPLAGGEVRTYNLAAPDSPRWNEYFVDLALAIGATPVRHLSPLQLRVDAHLSSPLLRLAGQMLARWRDHAPAREPLTPALLGVWSRQLRLDARAASRDLRLSWTPYPVALQEAACSLMRVPSPRPQPASPTLPAGTVPHGR